MLNMASYPEDIIPPLLPEELIDFSSPSFIAYSSQRTTPSLNTYHLVKVIRPLCPLLASLNSLHLVSNLWVVLPGCRLGHVYNSLQLVLLPCYSFIPSYIKHIKDLSCFSGLDLVSSSIYNLSSLSLYD